jgi:hypothetical protein
VIGTLLSCLLVPFQAPAENTVRFHNERLWSTVVEFPSFRSGGNVAGDRVFKIYPEDLLLSGQSSLNLSAWTVPVRFYEAANNPRLPDGEWRKLVFNSGQGRWEPDLTPAGLQLAYTGATFTFPAAGEYLVTYRFPGSGSRPLQVRPNGFAFCLLATPGEGVANCTATPTAGVHLFLSSRERYPFPSQSSWSGFYRAGSATLGLHDGTATQCAPLPAGELFTDMRFVEAVAANRNQSAWAFGPNPLPRDEGVGALYTNLATLGGQLAFRFDDRAKASAAPRYVVLPLLNGVRPTMATPLPGGASLYLSLVDPLLLFLPTVGVIAALDLQGTGESRPVQIPQDASLYGAELFTAGLVIDLLTATLSTTTTVRTRLD